MGAARRKCQSPEPAQAAQKHVSRSEHPSGKIGPQASTQAHGRLQCRCSPDMGLCLELSGLPGDHSKGAPEERFSIRSQESRKILLSEALGPSAG